MWEAPVATVLNLKRQANLPEVLQRAQVRRDIEEVRGKTCRQLVSQLSYSARTRQGRRAKAQQHKTKSRCFHKVQGKCFCYSSSDSRCLSWSVHTCVYGRRKAKLLSHPCILTHAPTCSIVTKLATRSEWKICIYSETGRREIEQVVLASIEVSYTKSRMKLKKLCRGDVI